MANSRGLVILFAATAGLASLLSAATPVMAAKSVTAAGEAPPAKTVSSMMKRRALRRAPTADSDYRRVSFIRGNRDCSWCGRKFVLMIGVGY